MKNNPSKLAIIDSTTWDPTTGFDLKGAMPPEAEAETKPKAKLNKTKPKTTTKEVAADSEKGKALLQAAADAVPGMGEVTTKKETRPF